MVSDSRTPSYPQKLSYPDERPSPAQDRSPYNPTPVIKPRTTSPWAATMSRMHTALNGPDDTSAPSSPTMAKRGSLPGPSRQLDTDFVRNYQTPARTPRRGDNYSDAHSVDWPPWEKSSSLSTMQDTDHHTRQRTQSFPTRPAPHFAKKFTGNKPPDSPSSPYSLFQSTSPLLVEPSIYSDPPDRREFETLATVFGMPELSEPKPLWERTEVPDILQSAIDAARILESQRHGPGFIDAKDKEAARKIPPHSSSPQLFSIPSSTSFTTTGSSQAQPISIIRKQQQQQDARRRSSVVSSNASFILPAIPSVSHFDELDDKISESSSSTRDGFRAQSSIMSLSPSHQQSYNSLLHPDARSIASTSSSDKFAISQAASSAMTLASLAPPTRAPSTVDQRAVTAVTNPEEVPPPLLFYDHPPSIFDLLKADDDDRIIVWGVDPNVVTTPSTGPSLSISTPQGASKGGFNTTPPISPPSSISKTSRWSSSFTDTLKRGGTFGKNSKDATDDSSYNPFRSVSRKHGPLPLRRSRSGSISGSPDKKQAGGIGSQGHDYLLASANKVIMAATVEKLVEKLTSTLDYTFMTDFFLTYRTFISPVQLCKLLTLRFRWALENDDEDRRVVRIRTFVTFRHWLLNYFVHDFIPSKALRLTFTSYLNSLPKHNIVRRSPRDQRIVKGLKRVVRRLKKVYLRKSSSNTHRVKVVRAPPPPPDQEKIEQMVRAKLSSHSLRKKTLAMGGNTAITDARSTPVVVVGSLRMKNGPFGSIRDDTPSGRPLSPSRIYNSDTVRSARSAKNFHMQQLQQKEQKDLELQKLQGPRRTSLSSDESLESELTPGATASEDESDDTEETSGDDSDGDDQAGDEDPEEVEVLRIEEERRRREEEEELKRAEFFGSAAPSPISSLNGKRRSSASRRSSHPPLPSFDPARMEKFAQQSNPSPPSSRPTSPSAAQTRFNHHPPPVSVSTPISSPYKGQPPSPGLKNQNQPPPAQPQDKQRKFRRPLLPTEFFAPPSTPSESLPAKKVPGRRDSRSSVADVGDDRVNFAPQKSTPQKSTPVALAPLSVVSLRKNLFEGPPALTMVPSKSEMGRPSTTPLYTMFARGDSVPQRSSSTMTDREARSRGEIPWLSSVPPREERLDPHSSNPGPESANMPPELRGLDKGSDYKNEKPPVGLARSLSKRSMDRRKSEKSLKGLYDVEEPPLGNGAGSILAKYAGSQPDKPMPVLPPAPIPSPSRPDLRKQQSLGNIRLAHPGEARPGEARPGEGPPSPVAAAAPGMLGDYHHQQNKRQSVPGRRASSLSKATLPALVPTASTTSRGSIGKVLGKILLKGNHEPEPEPAPSRHQFPNQKPAAISRKGGRMITNLDARPDSYVAPPPPDRPRRPEETYGVYPPTASTTEDQEAMQKLRRTPSGKFVSLIARELRKEVGVDCGCDACRGLMEGDVNLECKRFSIVSIGPGAEKRRSMELRHRRGASIEKLSDVTGEKGGMDYGSSTIAVAGNTNGGRNRASLVRAQNRRSFHRHDKSDSRSGIYSEVSGSGVLMIQEMSSDDDDDDDEEEEEFIITRDDDDDSVRGEVLRVYGRSADDDSTIVSRTRKALPSLPFRNNHDRNDQTGDRTQTLSTQHLIPPSPHSVSPANISSRALRRLPNMRDLKHVSSIREVEDDATKNRASWQSSGTTDAVASYTNSCGRSGVTINNGNVFKKVMVMNVGDTNSVVSSEVPEIGIMTADDDVVVIQETKKRNPHPLREGRGPVEYLDADVISGIDEIGGGMTPEAKRRVEDFVQQQREALTESNSTSLKHQNRLHSLPPLANTPSGGTVARSEGKGGHQHQSSTVSLPLSTLPVSSSPVRYQSLSGPPTTFHSEGDLSNYFHHPFILRNGSEDIAQQFCLIEKDVLLEVQWEELVHVQWTKMKKNAGGRIEAPVDDVAELHEPDAKMRRKNKGPGGVEKLIERFNLVCQWVAVEIVSTQALDERVKVVEKFIRIAQKCRNYSNFATLVQILLGLQSPSVSRLRKTWSRVGTLELKFLDELSAFTSPIKNWKHIRDNMTTVAEEYGMSPTEIQIEMPGTGTLRGIQDWVNPKAKIKIPFGGCIPFLGIFLSDLVFNSELPSYIESKVKQEQGELTRIYNIHASQTDDLSSVQSQPLVNFHKHRTTATVIKRVLIFQNLARRYPFKPKTDLHEYCDKLNSLDPDLVRKLSHYIEE